MQKEMQREERGFVRQNFVDVEQEAMQGIFKDRPNNVSKEEASTGQSEGVRSY